MQLIEAGDYSKSQQSISEHVDFLNSISSSVLSESENEDSEKTALEILAQIHQYISLPSLNQVQWSFPFLFILFLSIIVKFFWLIGTVLICFLFNEL